MDTYVNTQGIRIYYQTRGQGAPLLLLMGFGADGSMWERHVLAYEPYFRCIMVDNRGVGKSDQPEGPYTTAMMAADAIAVLDQEGIRCTRVAGISMGGAIAQELALNYPDRVHSLALISTWPKFNTYTKTVYENLKKLRLSVGPADFLQLLQLWIFAPPYYEQGMEDLRAAQQQALSNEDPQSRQGFEGQLDACINHDTVERLKLINVPTLISVGEMDVFTPLAYSILIHQEIAGSELVTFPHGGHVHHWEDIARFNDITTRFFLNG